MTLSKYASIPNATVIITPSQDNIDGLVQDCSNSIANALELLQSCTKPSIWLPKESCDGKCVHMVWVHAQQIIIVQ